MLSFFGAKSEKDLGDKLLGKMQRYRFPRHGAVVTVHGRLLAFYRCAHTGDDLSMPPANGRVELIAVFLTRAGRYLVYYVVSYPETEDIAGRHEYVHALESLTAMRAFLAVMRYSNRGDFAEGLLAQALESLERALTKGSKKSGKTPSSPPAPAEAVSPQTSAAVDAEKTPLPASATTQPQQVAAEESSDPANVSGV